MIITLRYTNSDERCIFRILSQKEVFIFKTKRKVAESSYIVILINNEQELNDILLNLNTKCFYSVSIVKRHKYNSLFDFIKHIFKK